MMNPAATIPEVTARGHRLLFRTVGTDVTQAAVACDWIAKNVEPDVKVAILHDKSM